MPNTVSMRKRSVLASQLGLLQSQARMMTITDVIVTDRVAQNITIVITDRAAQIITDVVITDRAAQTITDVIITDRADQTITDCGQH